jgi:L-malate glycosyltransferase
MQIHQFVHTLNYGDAISGEAIIIKRCLNELGVTSKIFALHAHPKVKDEITSSLTIESELDSAISKGEQVAIILHYSIASQLNDLFKILREKYSGANIARVLIYHNLTPVHYFESYNSRVAEDLIKGRNELAELCSCADIVLADSDYNRRELLEFGCNNADLLPLAIDSSKWEVPANPGIAAALKGHGGKNILHVGRLAPNKCIEDIIKAFYFYHHKIERQSRLWLVGIDVDTEIYSFELRSLVAELRLKEAVNFVGSVADSELRAFYENSDVYLCMSEHEGFCLPLLEAMHFKLPVVAFDSSAVKETLGGSGVLLQEKSPAELAELINILVTDQAFREQLIQNGTKRVANFTGTNFKSLVKSKIVDRVSTVLDASTSRPLVSQA